jgi:spoIIIJ-associated protein
VAKSIELRGRTVEEAISKGLEELHLSREQVEVELLNEGSRGLFGLGGAEAVVRLTPHEEVEAGPSVPAAAQAPAPTVEPLHPAAEPEPRMGVPGQARGEGREMAAAAPSAPKAPAASGKQVLETLLRGMGIRSEVVIRPGPGEEGPEFVLDIVGADLGILIGRRGETLRDLEYITRLIVAQEMRHIVRFAVDVEGYRARRERVLKELAKRMADRVRQNRQPITLEAMPPHERRIVHLTLREHSTVRTQSIGEGDHRRVMILPK